MRVLLDTNILIHREAAVVVHENIGILFNWLDRLHYEKYVHPISITEIQQHKDLRVRQSFAAKLASYRQLQAPAALNPKVRELSQRLDATTNSYNDTLILNELYNNRIDILLTEDRGIARKADKLGIGDRVFTIDAFLEKITAENPALADYKVLSVRKNLFGHINIGDSFFDSFRMDYPGFNDWFNRKSEEPAYICLEDQHVVAFLYLKVEDRDEPYSDIVPPFQPKKRLKVGTLKVELNGFKLGERFLKIIFDNAIQQRVDEIYVTLFTHTVEQERLIKLLEDFGFTRHGEKHNTYGSEVVYVRDMAPRVITSQPKLTFPFVSKSARHFLVPIYPDYHTELFPDSILNNESPANFSEPEPHRNAIGKTYISRSYFRDLHPGDVIVFYRTGGYYRGVVTTLGIIENVHQGIENEDDFIKLCRKRSVFSNEDLRKHWQYNPCNHPFVVDFLCAYSFPKRPNLQSLIENRVIADIASAPRGFEGITSEQFQTIIRLSETDTRLIID